MLAYSKPEIARRREVLLSQLVFLDLQTTLENFLCFGATDGDMDGDLFVTSNTECADCVAGFACEAEKGGLEICGAEAGREVGGGGKRTVHGCLTRQLFEHFGSTSKSVTRFANGDIEDELLDAELSHGVCALVFAGFRLQNNVVSLTTIKLRR